jgi:hypothetical protein
MEVLSRLLAVIDFDVDQFKFHPKCKSIKLNHLCFADDLLFSLQLIWVHLGLLKWF